MKFDTKYKLALWKTYFDKGMAITNYAKYMIAFYGLASQAIEITLLFGGIYFISCVILGWIWYSKDMAIAETEVGNNYNLFVKELRHKFIKKKK